MNSITINVVLRLSRMVGIAPIIMSKPEYRVSRIIDICGITILYCAGIFVIIKLLLPIVLNHSLITVDFIQTFCRILVIIITSMGAWTASERMKRMVDMLKQLDEIEQGIQSHQKRQRERTMVIVTLAYIIGCSLLRIYRFIINGYTAADSIYLLTIILQYHTVNLLEMQIITLAGRVLLTLKMLNQCLEQLIPEKHIFNEISPKPRVPRIAWENSGPLRVHVKNNNKESRREDCINENTLKLLKLETNLGNTIRQLADYYLKICEIIVNITEADGYLMVLMLVHHMFNLELNSQKVIIWASAIDSPNVHLLLPSIIRIIMHSTGLILCTEPFHQTHDQMARTRFIINRLKCQCIKNEQLSNELELFQRLLLLNNTTYSPLSLCTLTRSLIVKILGCLVSYFVIIHTYGFRVNDLSQYITNKDNLK